MTTKRQQRINTIRKMDGLLQTLKRCGVTPYDIFAYACAKDCIDHAEDTREENAGEEGWEDWHAHDEVIASCEAELDDGRDNIIEFHNKIAEYVTLITGKKPK